QEEGVAPVAGDLEQGPAAPEGRPRRGGRVGLPVAAAQVPHGTRAEEAGALHDRRPLRRALQRLRPGEAARPAQRQAGRLVAPVARVVRGRMVAVLPNAKPADWWRGLLVTA